MSSLAMNALLACGNFRLDEICYFNMPLRKKSLGPYELNTLRPPGMTLSLLSCDHSPPEHLGFIY